MLINICFSPSLHCLGSKGLTSVLHYCLRFSFFFFFFHFGHFQTYLKIDCMHAKSLQSCPTLRDPTDHKPARLPCPWDSPGKNTEVGYYAFLPGIFLTQGLNPGLLNCKQILYCLSHQGSPDRCVGCYILATMNESAMNIII